MGFVLLTQDTVYAQNFLVVVAKCFEFLAMFRAVFNILPLYWLPVLLGRRVLYFLLLLDLELTLDFLLPDIEEDECEEPEELPLDLDEDEE